MNRVDLGRQQCYYATAMEDLSLACPFCHFVFILSTSCTFFLLVLAQHINTFFVCGCTSNGCRTDTTSRLLLRPDELRCLSYRSYPFRLVETTIVHGSALELPKKMHGAIKQSVLESN